MFINRICKLPLGTIIPKPISKKNYTIKEFGFNKKGELAIAYTIPRNNKTYSKWITHSQLNLAYKEFCHSGEITKAWWKKYVAGGKDDGGCNFTTFGGFLAILGEANYVGRGKYAKLKNLAFDMEKIKLILTLMEGRKIPSWSEKKTYLIEEVKLNAHVTLTGQDRKTPSVLPWDEIELVFVTAGKGGDLTPRKVDNILEKKPFYSSTMCALVRAMMNQ